MNPVDHPFWQACARGAVAYQQCAACGGVQLHARPFCVRCLARDLAGKESRGLGVVVAVTTVFRAPDEAFRKLAPYGIALVDLDEGFRMMAQAAEGVRVGDRVATAFRRVGDRALPCVEPVAPGLGASRTA